jgi:putative two-component system response regulator
MERVHGTMPKSVSPGAGVVLVADDDPGVRDILSQSLSALSYRILTAEDGESALELAMTHLPDVIILDIVMPGMDGIEVCRRLKGNLETQFIPVVLITGEEGKEVRLEGLEAGASDFLRKPFDHIELNTRIRNLYKFRCLTKDLDSAELVVFSLARIIEARDSNTGRHCERLAALARRLGDAFGLGEEEVNALRRGGYLHDIGKVGIPDSILRKTGELSEEERVLVHRHPLVGARICSSLRTLRPVLPIIKHHHERLDGSGYPDGLKGKEIPLLARLFQVADIFDALTSDRSYRKAVSTEEALETLEYETSQGLRDPHAVEVLREMIRGNAAGR